MMAISVRIAESGESEYEKHVSKSGLLLILVSSGLLLALLNFVTFATPIRVLSLAVFYTSYGCAEGMLILLGIFSGLILFTGKSGTKKIMGLPIILATALLTAVQLLLTIIFYIVDAFAICPIWILILLELLILGSGFVVIAFTFYYQQRTREYHKSKADTQFMDLYRTKVSILTETNPIKSLQAGLDDLFDRAKASDPVASEETAKYDARMMDSLEQLNQSLISRNETQARKDLSYAKNLLLERNLMCKNFKNN